MFAHFSAAFPVFFAGLVAFCVTVYVLADGCDLGVGILLPFAPRTADRDAMIASIEPVWDGNETWLDMGGTLLLAVFPAGYYVLLPAFYLPVMMMLFALIFRGVAFGFRLQATRHRWVWSLAFAAGSLIAALCQGIALGGLIQGVAVRDGMFAGGPLDAFTPLGVLCGVGLAGGYALLGAGWLIWKTGGATQVFARDVAHAALILTAVMLFLVSAASAILVPEVADRWFSWPRIAVLAPVSCVTAAVIVAAWRSIWTSGESTLLRFAILIFFLGFGGLVVSLWPYVVPRHITVWDGLADPQALAFVGVGVLAVIPIVLAYQAHAYWIFRGNTPPPCAPEHGPSAPERASGCGMAKR
ncbi:cytochrome d ubiquinol oxidase subunit II [Acuticoccus sediminis]|uniref:cytochrome d ubiquinol oxidase subunit II n=1 Tax=Acuticoccus sediminis TaxID=2184697 RepID=UPI001CFEBC1F|nr:cytochrome d ubiquinol oxidase subunit II [Acuticoccus sediminis]